MGHLLLSLGEVMGRLGGEGRGADMGGSLGNIFGFPFSP